MRAGRTYEDKIPFRFILDYLVDVEIVIKPMFGCYGVYSKGRLCLFLMGRDEPIIRRDGQAMHKGVSIATSANYADQLKTVFPDAQFRLLKQDKVWIFVSAIIEPFEPYVIKAC